HVEAAEGLGGDHRVAQWQHEHAGAELDPGRAGGHRAEGGDGVEDRKGRLDAEDHVVPRPQRLEVEGLGALGVGVQRGDVGHLAGAHEVPDGQAVAGHALLSIAPAYPRNCRSGSRARSMPSSSSSGGGSSATAGATRKSMGVWARTSSTVTPACTAWSIRWRLSRSKPKTQSVVTTRETPPKSRPL